MIIILDTETLNVLAKSLVSWLTNCSWFEVTAEIEMVNCIVTCSADEEEGRDGNGVVGAGVTKPPVAEAAAVPVAVAVPRPLAVEAVLPVEDAVPVIPVALARVQIPLIETYVEEQVVHDVPLEQTTQLAEHAEHTAPFLKVPDGHDDKHAPLERTKFVAHVVQDVPLEHATQLTEHGEQEPPPIEKDPLGQDAAAAIGDEALSTGTAPASKEASVAIEKGVDGTVMEPSVKVTV